MLAKALKTPQKGAHAVDNSVFVVEVGVKKKLVGAATAPTTFGHIHHNIHDYQEPN